MPLPFNSPLNIIFLDANTVVDRQPLLRLHEIGVYREYSATTRAEIIPRIEHAHVVLTNKVPLDAQALRAAKNLSLIQVVATGTNIIDHAVAQECGVTVKNVAGYSTFATAQHTVALLLGLTNGVAHWARRSATAWCASPLFWENSFVPTELWNKTWGIVGYGAIGRQVGCIAESLGMKVVALDRAATSASSGSPQRLGWQEFFARADVISLHCPLTEETRHLINRESLALMKASSYLINTSRGGLVDSEALREALVSGQIRGAALDVLPEEPPPLSEPLVQPLPNLLITPHIAWAALEAQQRLMAVAVEQIGAFILSQTR